VYCTRPTTNGATTESSRILANNLMSIQQIGLPSAIPASLGPFELNVAERSLRKANQEHSTWWQAYDILIALLENAGEVDGKPILIARHGLT